MKAILLSAAFILLAIPSQEPAAQTVSAASADSLTLSVAARKGSMRVGGSKTGKGGKYVGGYRSNKAPRPRK